jgi:DNA modification methylase
MKIYTEDKQYKLYEGQMQEVLDSLPENSVDAIICDPPYELGFMGKSWDSSSVAFQKETWEHCLRVLKRGGFLLAFGGSRTFHRIACAIEDAGFEIRDTLMWLYGSGFPKSLNIGLAVDKLNGVESKILSIRKNGNKGGGNKTFDDDSYVWKKEFEQKEATNEWRGWGTALKPAYEPIIVARKPMKTSVAENVLKNRVGGINIDECRVGNEHFKIEDGEYDNNETQACCGNIKRAPKEYNGRFPANIITDGSKEVANGMPTENDVSAMRYFYCAKASKKDRDGGLDMFEEKQTTDGCIRENSETARKFGANSALRKNVHPTVKPCELMQYLIRLVAPKGSVVMDCFMGSGSTGKATMFENRERNANYYFIGIEMTSEYLPICKARIDYAINQYEYDAKVEEAKTGQMSIFEF